MDKKKQKKRKAIIIKTHLSSDSVLVILGNFMKSFKSLVTDKKIKCNLQSKEKNISLERKKYRHFTFPFKIEFDSATLTLSQSNFIQKHTTHTIILEKPLNY